MSLLDMRPRGAGGGSGNVTLADVAAASITTADQTFPVQVGTQLLFRNSGGDNLLAITESSGRVDFGDQVAYVLSSGNGKFNHLGLGDSAPDDPTQAPGSPCVIAVDESFTADYAGGFLTHFETLNNNDGTAIDGMILDVDLVNNGDGGVVSGLTGGATFSGSGINATIKGLSYYAIFSGSGSVDTLRALTVSPGVNFASGTISEFSGIVVLPIVAASTTVRTTAYGLRVFDITGAGTNYAIQTGAGQVSFGGQLSFANTNHSGVKLNNLTTVQRDALTASAGMLIYNTTTARSCRVK